MPTTTAPAHEHDAAHPHNDDRHHDLTLKSAYLHVIADAATSVLAITALAGGMLFGWSCLDRTMGLVGIGVVGAWAFGLGEIRSAVEIPSSEGKTRIADLHVWRVGRTSFACALTVVTHDPTLTPGQVRQQLAAHREIVHATIEVQRCA